jgi:hypothetical protein
MYVNRSVGEYFSGSKDDFVMANRMTNASKAHYMKFETVQKITEEEPDEWN